MSKYSYQILASSDGNLLLELYFPDGDRPPRAIKEEALAKTLARSSEYMYHKGFLPPDVRFMSSRDVAREYGFTRQYWEKLLREGKIAYQETRAGRITTNLWVQGYLDNKDAVDKYVRQTKKALRLIEQSNDKSGTIECPNCSEERLEYYDNVNSVDGLCRACSFQLRATHTNSAAKSTRS